MGPMHRIRGWGLVYGVCPWDSALVMGDLMGRRFGMGCGWFFFRALVGGGRGRGSGNSGTRPAESFSQDDAGFRTALYIFLLCIRSGSLAAPCARQSRTEPPILDALGQTRALFGLRQPVDLVHALRR